MIPDTTGPRTAGVVLMTAMLGLTLSNIIRDHKAIFAHTRNYMHLIAMLLVAATTTECIVNA
jgi:hypothetical protein